MKTNPIALSLVKKGIIIFSFYAMGTNSFAQIKFTLQKSNSFSSNENSLSDNKPNYYTSIDPNARSISGSLSFVTNDNEKAEVKNNKEIVSDFAEVIFRPTQFTYPINSKVDVGIAEFSKEQLFLYAKILKEYAKKNDFDTGYAFFCNMGILCTKKRFFVINLATMEIEESALVSHGRGQGPSVYDKQYSNEAGSRSTSLGRYQISKKYKGIYGESYKLIGLDSSNLNAYNRCIVLHSMSCIPEDEDFRPACVSDGCPAVSAKFLPYLNSIIDGRAKPILLWIFDSNLEEVVLAEKLMIEPISNLLYNGNF